MESREEKSLRLYNKKQILLHKWRSSFSQNNVISTGGGIVIKDKNREFLKKNRVYFLNNSIEILFERATKKREQRPLLKDITLDEFVSIYENRMNLYKECANITLNAENKSINEIVEEISNHEKFSF